MHPITYRDRTMIEQATAPLHARITRLEQELDIAAGALAIAKEQRDIAANESFIYRAVLHAAGFRNLDDLPENGVHFATALGMAYKDAIDEASTKLRAALSKLQ